MHLLMHTDAQESNVGCHLAELHEHGAEVDEAAADPGARPLVPTLIELFSTHLVGELGKKGTRQVFAWSVCLFMYMINEHTNHNVRACLAWSVSSHPLNLA